MTYYEPVGNEFDNIPETENIVGISDTEEFNPVLDEEIVFFDPPEYPIYLAMPPEILEMESFVGKPRKSKCWKDIVHKNAIILQQFVDSVKDEFQETIRIECSTDIMTYFSDKLLREALDDNHITLNRDLEESTICLYKENRND